MTVQLRRFVRVMGASIGSVLIAAAGSTAHASAQTPSTATLTVRVTGMRNTTGKLAVSLFRDASGFPEDASRAIRAQEVDIDARTFSAEVVFHDVPEGIYAVAVRHDENMNGKLDRNFLGTPTEGYGASNNPEKKMRAPTFEEAKFRVEASDQTLEIRIIY